MILIRADANKSIGTGHVMRCMSIAAALKNSGQDVVFVTADDESISFIESKGVRAICLNSNWTDMESEIPELEKILNNTKADLLLIDSYYVTKRYFDLISPNVRTVYIDDLNEKTWNIDTLINYEIYSSEFDYSEYKDTKLFLGTEYTPLRAEFGQLGTRQLNKEVTDILVSAGGSDPQGVTEMIIKGICGHFRNIQFHIIVGALNPRLNDIKAISQDNITLHINETNMSGLMLKCDIAIAAAGSTLYELCACGTPTISYSLADNQMMVNATFEKKGLMLNAGDVRANKDFAKDLFQKLDQLINDFSLRQELSSKMQSVVDGNGAERIAKALIQ